MYLHRSDRSDRARVSGESGEGSSGASLLNVVVSQAGREMGRAIGSLGNGDDIGAVNHLADILTKNSQFGHGSLERALEFGLVVCEGMR